MTKILIDVEELAGIMRTSRVLRINDQSQDMVSHRLADYFEREDKCKDGEKHSKKQFNKQQFLKDCGIKEVE